MSHFQNDVLEPRLKKIPALEIPTKTEFMATSSNLEFV